MAQDAMVEDSGDIKKKALTRLAVAGIVTALTLVALWWLDSSGKKTAETKKATPSPIIAAPSPEMPPPSAEAEAPSVAPAQTETAVLGEPAVPPPPPEVISVAPQPRPISADKVSARSAPTLSQTVEPNPAPQQVPAHVTSSGASYQVQLGVFADPENAKELVDRLNKAGIQAHMETRVQVGPFKNRAEAEKAQAEIQRLGLKGVIARK